jgi:ADP-ribose pyrophosphatase
MSDQISTCSSPKKLTSHKYVNLFTTDVTTRKGSHPWIFASRKERPGAALDRPDAVVIVAIVNVAGESRLVLTREFRPPLNGYEISLPSGLVDEAESVVDAAVREMKEETGLTLSKIAHVSPALASSAGLTDETIALVYAEATGTLSAEHQEAHEDIATRLVSLAEIEELLRSPKDIISSRLYPILVGYVATGAIALPRLVQSES